MNVTDEWMRRRIRAVYWKLWKRVRTKYRRLRELGCERWKAMELANSRKAYWRMAVVLNSVMTNKIIAELGYMPMLDYSMSPWVIRRKSEPYGLQTPEWIILKLMD